MVNLNIHPIDDAIIPYRNFVDRGVSLERDDDEARIDLSCYGLAGETGEVIDLIKKVRFHGKDLNRDDLIKELGDVLWYFTLLTTTLGINLSEILAVNVEKLTARYPEKHPNDYNPYKD